MVKSGLRVDFDRVRPGIYSCACGCNSVTRANKRVPERVTFATPDTRLLKVRYMG